MQFHGPGEDWSRAPVGPGHGERGSGKYRPVYGEEHALGSGEGGRKARLEEGRERVLLRPAMVVRQVPAWPSSADVASSVEPSGIDNPVPYLNA